jgi:hypothetical protein
MTGEHGLAEPHAGLGLDQQGNVGVGALVLAASAFENAHASQVPDSPPTGAPAGRLAVAGSQAEAGNGAGHGRRRQDHRVNNLGHIDNLTRHGSSVNNLGYAQQMTAVHADEATDDDIGRTGKD